MWSKLGIHDGYWSLVRRVINTYTISVDRFIEPCLGTWTLGQWTPGLYFTAFYVYFGV